MTARKTRFPVLDFHYVRNHDMMLQAISTVLIMLFLVMADGISAMSDPVFDSLNGRPIDPEEMHQSDSVRDDPIPRDDQDPILNMKLSDNGFGHESLFQGDIVINKPFFDDSGLQFRNAIRNQQQKWPNGVVPYIIASSFTQSERLVIAKAMKAYHDKSCIKFTPRTSQRDYIYIMKGSGCYSSIGRTGGKQDVSLGNGCVYTGIAIHELMHAVGFWHEQSREDRDSFITILWQNIIPSMKFNFEKQTQRRIDHLGVSYDTCSVMHYNAYAFSQNRQPTIIKKANTAGSCELGQRAGFSDIDIQKVNKLYKCDVSIGGGTDGGTGDGTEDSGETTTTTTKDCVDIHKHCVAWGKLGECKKNPEWMLPNCPVACNQCTLKCKDYSKHCKRWAELGECDKNKPYMSAYCVRSCYCGKDCSDDAKECRYWAKKGYCKDPAFGDYMELRCRKSCRLC